MERRSFQANTKTSKAIGVLSGVEQKCREKELSSGKVRRSDPAAKKNEQKLLVQQDERPRKVKFGSTVLVKEFDQQAKIVRKEKKIAADSQHFARYTFDEEEEMVKAGEITEPDRSDSDVALPPATPSFEVHASEDHAWYHTEYTTGVKLTSKHCKSYKGPSRCCCMLARVDDNGASSSKLEPFGVMTERMRSELASGGLSMAKPSEGLLMSSSGTQRGKEQEQNSSEIVIEEEEGVRLEKVPGTEKAHGTTDPP